MRRRDAAFDPSRRRLMMEAGGAAVAVVFVLSVLPRKWLASLATLGETTPSPSATGSPAGTKIGSVADLQSQGSLPFNDPATRDPGLVVQANGKIVAFDAVCTHAGCTVSYDPSQKLFLCPCHGAEFDPANNAAVVAGPAPTPLPSIKVTVSGGDIYTA